MSTCNLHTLQALLYKAVSAAGFDVEEGQIRLDQTKTLEHGHFACNIALVLAQKSGKNPREVADAIVRELKSDLLQKVEVAGPGFINLFVEQKFYSTELGDFLKDPEAYTRAAVALPKRTMVIDYSHPNIAKPMGVHHLLSTVIGDSIKKLYQKTGTTVIADNFIGDMGTQFGKLIHAIKTWGNLEEIEKDPINNLLKLYVQFHFEADKDVELDEGARAEYKKFEEGDKENRELWKKIKAWSLKEIQPIYDRLHITFDHLNGESFYEDKMDPILEAGRKSGVIVDGEKGAWIILSDDPNDPPTLVKKSDGATLYMTRDLARTAYWEKTWHPDLMLIVTDVAQSLHFKQVFEAARKLNLTDAKNVHVAFGRMQFKDVAMSTRKGNILRLTEVLDEAEERALALVKQKAVDFTEAEQKELARILGVGSVKYNILHQNRIMNLTFDWEKMLTFEGNAAPYLVYTAARANSILRKSEVGAAALSKGSLQLAEALETKLAIELLMYPDALRRAAEEYKPHHIANYLFGLAQAFNSLYNDLPILKAEKEAKATRLMLTAAVVAVMKDALGLLGIEIPDKM